MSARSARRLSVATCFVAQLMLGAACGDDRPRAASDGSPPATEGLHACLPGCFLSALASCQPEGDCVLEADPRPAGSFEWRACFANGVRTHVIARAAEDGTTSEVDVRQHGALCRSIATRESAAGASFVVKDPSGRTVITATIRSPTVMTVFCGEVAHEVDRTSDCGRAALRLLSGRGDHPDAPHSCVPGPCP
jgi:hypothetical protein